MLRVILVFVFISNAVCQVCDPDRAVDISSGQRLSTGEIHFENVNFQRTEYFTVDSVVRACVCNKKVCVLKCCPFGYVYHNKEKACVNSTSDFNPPVKDEYLVTHKNNFHYEVGKPTCAKSGYRISLSQVYQNFHQRPDGNLYIEVPASIPPWVLRGPDKYCIDTFLEEDESGETKSKLDALVCFENEADRKSYIIGPTCMLISCIFILATVAVYAWLPELRNLHGRVLMAYLLCLLVGFLCLSTLQILLTIDNIKVNSCVILTIIVYFSLLAAFFWLNVMSFDIWWTFSGKRGITREKMSVNTKFCAYAMYAFGVPTALTVLLVALEFSGLPPNPYLPLLRQQGCFLFGKSKLLYLYSPMTILCVANMVFFILTSTKIRAIKRETSVLKSKESATHDQQNKEKQRLLLYIKLFVVMGINWLLEVISAIYPEADNLWNFTDAYNVLIGLNIFIIFVCKRKIFFLLKKRVKGLFNPRISNALNVPRNNLHINNNRFNLEASHHRVSLDTIRTCCNDNDSAKGSFTTSM